MSGEGEPAVDLRQQLSELLQEQRQLIESLRQGQAYFQQLGRAVWRVQEDERRRLAHELHDGVGPSLTAMIHLVSSALGMLPEDSRNAALRDTLAKAHSIGESALQDTRALSRLLRPQILDDLGLEQAMHWLVRTMGETHGFEIVLDFSAPAQPLENDRATLIFRVAQEALANVARHARARRVELDFRADAQLARLRVRDDGCGCDVADALAAGSSGASSGLGGMRDRLRLFGGSVRIESSPGHGWCIESILPLHDLAERSDS
jgi:signal transduction histidine kinase